MRKVLAIAFDFPPRRTSGVYRLTGLIKYLSSHGWMATVLTVRGRKGDFEDATLLERIPAQVRVVRSGYFKVTGWEDDTARAVRRTGALRPQAEGTRASALDRVLRRLGDFVRSCLYFPDETIGWVPFGLLRAIQLCNEHHFDAVYTTSPPKSAPVIGLLLKLLTGIRWVAEFRDPWYPPQRPLRRRFERALFSALLRRADALVVISEGHADELIRAHHVPRARVTVVSNGYEEGDFGSAPTRSSQCLPGGFIHLSHFGNVYPNFSGMFFPALAEFVRECPAARKKLRVNIIGSPDAVVQSYANDRELGEVVQLHGFLEHPQALNAMFESHCLLVFLGHQEVCRLSGLGKVYEYLRVGRPILAISYDGGTQSLIERGKAGWVVRPEDVEGIKKVLWTVFDAGENGHLLAGASTEFASQFRYDRLAGRLASVLDKVVRHVH